MEQYRIILPKNYNALVLHKREGIRRPGHFLFFKKKKREKLIAYTVNVQRDADKNEYMVYKTKTDGKWLNGAHKDGESMGNENEISLALKQAIDDYEGKLGAAAYKELF
ncbi:MAG: hypothetical protein ACTHMM_17925 [Agriterribacter sp.]